MGYSLDVKEKLALSNRQKPLRLPGGTSESLSFA